MVWFKKKILEHITPHKGRTYILCHDTFLSIARVMQNGLLLSGAAPGKATPQGIPVGGCIQSHKAHRA